ncbi:MAG: hypothetical protein AAFU84_08030 [Cyanobacteria bacterium J06633_23]
MGLSKSKSATPQVKLLVSPASARIPWPLLSWLALGGGVVFVVAVILSGARLIVDPYSPNWLKTAFPGLVNSFEATPQTADEIQAEMRSQGITAGQPIAWPQAARPQAWFYPVLKTDDRSIEELWVYRVQGDRLQRIDQVAIRPLKESFITTPLVGTASQVASVDSNATLTSIKLMPATNGPWLLLEGQRRYGNTVMRYGQILSYQPRTQRIHRLLNWSSPAGQPPQWQTSSEQLLIDQTVGLRPSFLLYQLIPNDPPQLQEVSLYRSVYGADLGTSLYEKALKLAQGAVWSHSLQMMQSAKAELGADWSAAAQTQLDLIGLHADRTKAQTEQTWSSQQQHILTYLIDGQWGKALAILEDKPEIYDSTLQRLARDFDALWRAVTIHLQVHPKDVTTQIWGALLVTARQSPEAGEDWLTKKTRSKTTLERLQAVGRNPLELASGETVGDSGDSDATGETSANVSAPPTTTNAGRYLSLVGQARAMTAPDGGWLRSQTLPTLVQGQTWYHIDVQLLQDSSGWGLPPSITAANFWADSLSLRRQLQLFSGDYPVAGLAVHGVKTTHSGLALLAIGPEVEAPALVATGHSLQWLSTMPWQTAPIPSVAGSPDEDNNPPTPANDSVTGPTGLMASTLGAQLSLTPEQTAQLYPYLQYASLDLTGDSTAEQLFHVGPNLPPELAIPPGKTIIFSGNGELLYSDVGQPQSLLALTPKSTERPATLLIEQADRYTLMGL